MKKYLLESLIVFSGTIFAQDQTIASCYQQTELDILYSPWRHEYNSAKKEKSLSCPFCRHFTQQAFEEKNFVLLDTQGIIVLLTMYPYHDGHLIVFPKDHVEQLHELSSQTRFEMSEIISEATKILKEELGALGFNIGYNIGQAGGASVPDHIHIHIVPRKKNDLGFMQMIGQTKHIKQDLVKLYEQLKPAFDKKFNG